MKNEASPNSSMSQASNRSFSSNAIFDSPNKPQLQQNNTSLPVSPSSGSPLSSLSTPTATVANRNTYIVIEILKSQADRLLALLQSRLIHLNIDSVLEYDELVELANSAGESNNLALVLAYLEAQRKIFIDSNCLPGKRVVKFAAISSGRHVAGNITEIELAFLKVFKFFFFFFMNVYAFDCDRYRLIDVPLQNSIVMHSIFFIPNKNS